MRTRLPARGPLSGLPVPLRTYSRNFNIWLQRYKQASRYQAINLKNYIKKLLVYYPKDPQILKLFTLQIHNEDDYNEEKEPIPEIRRLYTRFACRYKRDLLLSQNLNVGWDKFPVWQTCKTARFLKFCQTSDAEVGLASVIKKTIKANKYIKAIQFGKDLTCLEEIVSNLRYVRSLESFYIKNIPSIPIHIFKRGIFASSQSLQNVTLRGEINYNPEEEQQTTTTSGSVQLVKIILKLPHLKRFNFDIYPSDQTDINKIPFNILKKKDVSYNIRLINNQNKFALSPAAELGLESLGFLAINTISSWCWYGSFRERRAPEWTFFEEQQLKVQEETQRVLFISLFKMKKVDLMRLIPGCRNITTLNISLSIRDRFKRLDFTSLKYLQNLQHLFLVIDNLREYSKSPWPRSQPKCCSSNLFRNLHFCAGRLKSVSIHLAGETTIKNNNKILAFFQACSDSLTHFTLMFTRHDIATPAEAISILYKGIMMLKTLESLKLKYDSVGYISSSPIYQFEGLGQCQNLKELYISTTGVYFNEFNVPNLENLEKLHIGVDFLEEAKMLLQISNLIRLKHLELHVNVMYYKAWTKVLKMLSKLKALETVKLHCKSNRESKTKERNIEETLAELKILKETHLSLVCLAYGEDRIQEGVVWFFGRSPSSWKREVDSFFWRDREGLPKQKNYKVYCL